MHSCDNRNRGVTMTHWTDEFSTSACPDGLEWGHTFDSPEACLENDRRRTVLFGTVDKLDKL